MRIRHAVGETLTIWIDEQKVTLTVRAQGTNRDGTRFLTGFDQEGRFVVIEQAPKGRNA